MIKEQTNKQNKLWRRSGTRLFPIEVCQDSFPFYSKTDIIWWSRTKALLSPGNWTLFLCKCFGKKLFHWPLPWPMLHGCIPRIQNEVRYKTLSLDKLFLNDNKKMPICYQTLEDQLLVKAEDDAIQQLAGWQWVFPVHFPFAYYLFIAENNGCMTIDIWLGELLRHKIKGIQ